MRIPKGMQFIYYDVLGLGEQITYQPQLKCIKTFINNDDKALKSYYYWKGNGFDYYGCIPKPKESPWDR